MKKECPNCQSIFDTNNPTQRYCGSYCARQHKIRMQNERWSKGQHRKQKITKTQRLIHKTNNVAFNPNRIVD